jgi:hypothetical protein
MEFKTIHESQIFLNVIVKRGNLQEEAKPAMIMPPQRLGLAQFDGEKLICPMR